MIGESELKEELLLLKIQNALDEGKDYYEAIRGNWKVSKDRFDYIQYTVGFERGKVVCVFQPDIWSTIEKGKDKGRKCFEGKEAPSDILSKLQKSEQLLIRKFGSGNPVAYALLSEIE